MILSRQNETSKYLPPGWVLTLSNTQIWLKYRPSTLTSDTDKLRFVYSVVFLSNRDIV